MLKNIYVENFMRVDERVSIELGPVSILVGANGSGKSSILKALHWAARCAARRSWSLKLTLEQMDYTPSREFLELAHRKKIQSAEDSQKIGVGFVDENDEATEIKINASRNEAGVKVAVVGPLTSSLTGEEPQTAYIPGLAGLAESETVLARPVLHRKAASGEGGSVLRHMLLELAGGSDAIGSDYKELGELNSWVGRVVPNVRFWVKFDRLKDVIIDAQFLTEEMKSPGKTIAMQRKPLEMAGTGFLQIVQIFAYLLVFKPRLLLIDEPDAHLHPGTQERLIKAIEEATAVFPQTQFVITTHSPSLVRACGEKTRVHWMANGQLRNEHEEITRRRMGWGALDKEVILFTEDEKLQPLQSILSQWPDLARKTLLWPTFGHSGLPSGEALTKLRETLKIGVVIHRDRDFMSNSDVAEWKKKKGYTERGIPVWITPGSDIEANFCCSQHLSAIFDVTEAEADLLLAEALMTLDADEVERSFNTALYGAVASLPADVRSTPSARWRELGSFSSKTVKGKQLCDAVAAAVTARYRGTPEARKLAGLSKLKSPTHAVHLAECLKPIIESALLKI